MNEFCIFLSDPNTYCALLIAYCFCNREKIGTIAVIERDLIIMHLCALFLGGVVGAVLCALVIMQNDKVYHCSDSEAWVRA